MATEIFEFSGVGKWINLLDKKFEPAKRKTNLYLDKASEATFKKAGLKLKFKEDDDGKYITFSRKDADGAPFVFLAGEKDAYEGKIGNGSVLTVKVEVYDTKSFGKGHRVEAIRIDNLVEYTEGGEEGEGQPRKAAAMPF